MRKLSDKLKARLVRMKHGVHTARGVVRAWRLRLPPPLKRVLRRATHWTLHSTLGVVIAIALIFGAVVLWLPTLADRKGEIESYLSTTLGNPVTLDALDTYWEGLNPGVRVKGLRVQSAATGLQAIRLKEMRLSLAWWPLLTGRIEINSLVLVEPSLTAERAADGRLRIGGIEAGAAAVPADTDFTQLLLAQREVIIENGALLWLDRRTGVEPERFYVPGVYLELRNDGDRHRLQFRADFPVDLCADCRVSADIRGRPFREATWRGEIGIQASALSTRGLPRVLRELLPSGLAGRFDLRLVSQWRNARPESVEGRLAATELSLPVPEATRPLTVQALDTKLNWKGNAEAWRLDLSSLRLGLTRPAWSAGRLHLDVQPDRLRFDVEHVDVADLAAFTAALPREHALLDWLRAAQPAGSLKRLRLELNGPLSAPTAYMTEVELRAVRFAAHERLPGMRGLSGQLSLTGDGGEFRLDSGDLEIALPNLLREPLAVQRLSSRIRWRQNPDDWFVQAQNIVMKASDGRARGEVELRLPKDKALSPVLKLGLDFQDGDGRQTARYLPLNLPEGLRRWIARAVVSGRVTDGHVLYHGAVRNFPFRDGKGRFEVRVHVRDGVLEYLPGWETLRDIDADFHFTGTSMLITGTHGRIRKLDVGRVVVAIDDFKGADTEITVQGRASGALQETLSVLSDSKAPRLAAWIPAGVQAEGNGVLTVNVRIPARAPQQSGIDVFYRCLNNNLEFPLRAIRAENIRGSVEFNEAGLRTGKLDARLFGGETVFEAMPDATQAGAARIEARGAITQTGFTQLFGPALSPYVLGQAPWQARLSPGKAGTMLHVESDLSGVELRLPAPLAKAPGEPLLLVMDSSPAGAGMQLLDLRAGNRLSGRLAFRHQAPGFSFAHGRIGIGETLTPLLGAEPGLHLSARLPALDADRWWPLLRHNLNDRSAGGWLEVVNRVSAQIEALEAFGREFGRLSLDVSKTDGNWRGRLRGDAITGQVAITRTPAASLPLVVGNVAAPDRPTIHLTLEKLLLPATRDVIDETPTDPRQLPPLHIKSQSFSFAGFDLGELEFSALPATHGWKIASLKLTRPESNLTASGLWQVDGRAQHTTRLDATLNSMDLGVLLDTLGHVGEMAGGKLTMQSNWSWPGTPGAFRLAQTDGDLSFTLASGRILKISPGAGRLLGVLDLQSITRYLTLDFSGVFGKGLTFDKMKGRVAVEKGNAYTRDLVIRTPGASLDLSGRVGLSARDLDLEIGATPHLMEELAIAGGLIGGPIVGAAVVVLHNLVKKPFEKSTRVDYRVKGGWDEPVVTRVTPVFEPSEEQR